MGERENGYMGEWVIGICDDQKKILLELKKIILNIQKEWNCAWDIRIFNSGEELLKQGMELNLVFLDIEMPELDGIETGKRLKCENPECKIVIATGQIERFKEAFWIQAFRFITKPFELSEIKEALRAATERNVGSKTIELYHMRNAYEVSLCEIQYIEAYNGYTEFTANNKKFRKDISMNKLEEILEEKLFCRIHRKYIVNFQWIESYCEDCVKINEKKIPVSRRKKKEFEHKYIEYDLNL